MHLQKGPSKSVELKLLRPGTKIWSAERRGGWKNRNMACISASSSLLLTSSSPFSRASSSRNSESLSWLSSIPQTKISIANPPPHPPIAPLKVSFFFPSSSFPPSSIPPQSFFPAGLPFLGPFSLGRRIVGRIWILDVILKHDNVDIEKICKPGNFIRAAWTRRSRGEAAKRPNRKSWKQRTDMYMRPFLLNVFFSKRFVHAKVVHRGTSKVVSVATTNAKDLRNTLPSLTDNEACRTIGRLIAERSKDADIFAMSYEPKKNERLEGRLGIVLDTIKENGIIFV
ncbi:hypothetical protein ACLOJK_030341 [Asimina triloba]